MEKNILSKFSYRIIKNDIMFMHLFCIYKKLIILSLNLAMYIVTILTCPLKTYVVRLHNLTSMNIFFNTDDKMSQVFFVIVKKKPKSSFNKHWEAATRGVQKVFLEISQNLQESTCVRISFLIKFQTLGLQRY